MSTKTRRPTKDAVETLLAPAVYGLYVVLAYGVSLASCALASNGEILARNATFALTLGAFSAVAVVALFAARQLMPGKAPDEQDLLVPFLTLLLALVSALAVLWTGIARMVAPVCF